MNAEPSRRSACDRCRGQKLRCLRQLPPGGQVGDEALVPCDRCLKAGAECINNIYPPRRRITGSVRIQNYPTSSAPSQDRAPQSLFPKNLGIYSSGGSSNRPTSGVDVRQNESSVQFDNVVNAETQQIDFQQSMERPTKRRSLDPSYNQLGFSINNMDPGRYAATLSHPSTINGASSSSSGSNSVAIGNLDNGSINLDTTSPTLKVNDSFRGSVLDFGISLTPPPPHHNSNPGSLSDAFLPGHETSNSGNTGLLNDNQPAIPPMNSPEDCLHCLSELCSGLLKNVSDYGASFKTLADVLSYNPRLSSPTASALPKNAIGHVLESSQAFLDILGTLTQLLSQKEPEPSSPVNSECSYSDLWDSGEFLASAGESSSLPEDSSAGVRLPTNSNESAQKNSPDNQGSAPPPPTPLTLNIPTTLTILTCYTWLLHTYDTIFIRIHTSLGSKASAIPCILPGLTVGGFNLYDRKDLQVEILMQLSTKMLERIEEILGISVISAPRQQVPSKGLLDATTSNALLDVMFRPTEDQNTRVPRVKQTMDDIRVALRRSSA